MGGPHARVRYHPFRARGTERVLPGAAARLRRGARAWSHEGAELCGGGCGLRHSQWRSKRAGADKRSTGGDICRMQCTARRRGVVKATRRHILDAVV